jgi:hypothetical protein
VILNPNPAHMKNLCFTTTISLLLLICFNGLQAQTTQTKLNQVELMKQFIGTWKSVEKDTTFIWECKSFGEALEFTIKDETKGKVTIGAKSVMGYDKENDWLIESVIQDNSPEIFLCPCWFASTNTFIQIMWRDIANPENANLKWTVEFKSPDSFVVTEIKNNKTTFANTYHREK